MVDLDRSVLYGTREQGLEEHLLPERDMGLIGANREVMGHVSDVVTWVGELLVVIGEQGRQQTDFIT